jgi:hypothetical protein
VMKGKDMAVEKRVTKTRKNEWKVEKLGKNERGNLSF